MMDDIVGIDLGTTNSLIGILEAGFPILLAGAEGARLTPSVVFFPEDGEPVVGNSARRMRTVRPDSTVYSVKRFMGLRGEDVVEGGSDVAYQVDRRKGRPVTIFAGGQTRRPEEISALILKKLKPDAERALGHPISRAVITVPAYFNDAQRSATKTGGRACRILGRTDPQRTDGGRAGLWTGSAASRVQRSRSTTWAAARSIFPFSS